MEELDFDRFGAWLLARKLSVGIASADPMGRPFKLYYDSRCVGQGATLSEAIRDAGSITFVEEV